LQDFVKLPISGRSRQFFIPVLSQPVSGEIVKISCIAMSLAR
jgi:hypothetical protein